MSFDERLVLNKESKTNIIYDEHLVRYQLAAKMASGKIVLDIACGSGYGSKILAEAGAKKVVAIDKSPEALQQARENYSHTNLLYKEGDAENISEADESFDLVVSFETIEHLPSTEKYLAEIARVASREGIFLVSTPNREVFGQKNPYHLREFTRGEFEEALKKYFKNIFILEQTNGIASVIKAGESASAEAMVDKSGKIYFSDSGAPLYFIAVCSNNTSNLSELFKESIVSVNPAALEKIRNNPVVKIVDKVYSLIMKLIKR
jgi:ubiquinone/menaquinone biosynthesis C-methylase UbiE